MGISSIKFVEGDGIDGVTNSFAAAIWVVDFTMEAALFQFYDINFEGHMYDGNFQGILGPGP